MSYRTHYLIPARVVHTGISVLLLSLVFGLLNTVLLTRSRLGPSIETIIDGEHTSIPVIPQLVALRYEEISSNLVDWDGLFPPGRGFIRMAEGGERYYAISLYHQIHCLNNLEAVFRSNTSGGTLPKHDSHLLHCFGYLRQLALCAADSTLEPSDTMIDGQGQLRHVVFGTRAIHQCRDWRQVWNYAAENYQAWKDKDYFGRVGPN